MRPTQSLTLPEAKIWRCEASCVTKAIWVSTMPRAPAMSSWNQLSPSSTMPAMMPPSASARPPNTA